MFKYISLTALILFSVSYWSRFLKASKLIGKLLFSRSMVSESCCTKKRGHKWQDNFYLNFRMPYTTYIEGLLGLVFLGIFAWSVANSEYILLVFHGMLAMGYLLVFYYSFKSYRINLN